MLQILFALLAGVLTVGAPCILPLLPILLGASIGQQSKTRPLFIALGFIVTFTAAALGLSYLVSSFNLSPDVIRNIAIFALTLFAVFMIWPRPFELLTLKMGGAINKAGKLGQSAGSGNLGGFVLGLTLGLIWTPCAGPILASILTLIAVQGSSAQSATLLIAYALGAGIPMIIIAYGGQWVTTRVRFITQYAALLQKIFGFLILLLALAMYFQYDTKIQAELIKYFPATNLERGLIKTDSQSINNNLPPQKNVAQKTIKDKINFSSLGKAPEFAGISQWLNPAEPLRMADLKGKVVLIDFWTYSCINCIRTLPYVTKWYDTYKDDGFVVIGVHTPEFTFEKVAENVKTAIKRFNINYPVAQDNDFKTWNAYKNQYWPAEYLIDQNGEIVYTHFGEGNYDHTENAIRQLLGLNEPSETKNPIMGKVESPEMYFGMRRIEYIAEEQAKQLILSGMQNPWADFVLPKKLGLNHFALEGKWSIDSEKAKLVSTAGKIRLKFKSGKVFMVASSEKPIDISITVDNKLQPAVRVEMSQLYTLFDSDDYSEHTIDIEIPKAGFEAFTFTFG